MFDVFKDSKGKFNKQNILPLVGATIGSAGTALHLGIGILGFFLHPSLSDPSWEQRGGQSYGDFLAHHVPLSIIAAAIVGLYTYFPIDNIRKNKQIENFKANFEEPSSFVYNTLVDSVEQQSIA